jgi:Raf kinase inhibitor-like YbhB/YbcL family protein
MALNSLHSRIEKQLQAGTMLLSSSAFKNLGSIPREFTSEGACCSPSLNWENLPEGTHSLVLIMVDYDIPSRKNRLSQFIHWVVYNLPPGVGGLPANFGQVESAQFGATIAQNSSGRRWYYPPCPVSGEHEYTFRLFALDIPYIQPGAENYPAVMKAIEGHVLSSTELVGVYQCTTLNTWQALLKNIKLGLGKI